MKTCTKCKEPQSFSEFCKDSHKPDGLSSHCKTCRMYRWRIWSADNPDKTKAAMDRYRAAHPELVRERVAQYRIAHPEKILAKQRAWQQVNRDKISYYNRKRKAAVRGATGEGVTVEDWEDIQDWYGRKCIYCGSTGTLTQDHATPISRGGLHEPINIVPACQSCNSKKHALTLEEFLNNC